MKKIMLLTLALLMALSVPVLAQEEQMEHADQGMPAPPPPLNSEWANWLVGHWEGSTTNEMGQSKETHDYRLGLDGQFLLLTVQSEMGEMSFKGMGAVTMNEAGELVGYWIDNFRTMAEGKGKLEGNKETMVWKSPAMGDYTRIMEKIDQDNFRVTAKMTTPDGQMMEETGKFTRVKMTDK